MPAPPFTCACWFQGDDVATQSSLLTFKAAGNDQNRMTVNGSKLQGFHWNGVSAAQAEPTPTLSAGTWYHGCYVEEGTARAVYLDGGNKATNATSRSPGAYTSFGISYLESGNEQRFNGRIGMVTVWDVALSDAEAASLGAGTHPSLVRPGSIVAHWDLLDADLKSQIGGLTLTNNSSVVSQDNPAPLVFPQGVF